jgi:Na+-driven multidrug efflux pump
LGATPPQAAGDASPLAQNGGDDKPLPTIRDIAMFSGPALALWISSPLLSVIDSSAVGLSGGASSAMALAAMGPGTTVMDGSTYLFAFLNVATTNLLATAAANGDRDEVHLVMATAKRYALRCGVGVAALLLVAAPYMYVERAVSRFNYSASKAFNSVQVDFIRGQRRRRCHWAGVELH